MIDDTWGWLLTIIIGLEGFTCMLRHDGHPVQVISRSAVGLDRVDLWQSDATKHKHRALLVAQQQTGPAHHARVQEQDGMVQPRRFTWDMKKERGRVTWDSWRLCP